MDDPNLSSFIWSVADLLRGDYKQSEYGRVILTFTVESFDFHCIWIVSNCKPAHRKGKLQLIDAELKVVTDRILTIFGGLWK